MTITRLLIGLAASCSAAAATAAQAPVPAPAYSYADLADLALPAQIVAQVQVARATRLKPAEAPGLAPGSTRFYVEADVLALIRGPGGLSSRIAYLSDLPAQPDGKAARLRKGDQRLIFAQPVPGRPNEVRLTAPQSQIIAAAPDVAKTRTILREAADARAAPRITGIGRSFHVPGSLPGESETQVFLQTADNRPVSLNILRRPGERPRWSVALTEIVDEGATAPVRDTLLWYRLACGLPRELPARSLTGTASGEAAAIRTDYRFVLDQLGSCGRTRAGR